MISVNGIAVEFGGEALFSDVSFVINENDKIALMGKNGAGKSTMMKILTTYINANEGSAKVNGFDVTEEKQQVQQSVGYLPEHNPLYLDMYVKEYLLFNASIYKIPKIEVEKIIKKAVSQTRL